MTVKSILEKLTVHVDSPCTVENPKKKIHDMDGIPTESQKLIFGGRELKNGHTHFLYNRSSEKKNINISW